MERVSFHLFCFNSIVFRGNFNFLFVFINMKLEGHSGINLVPIDPLHIPSISIKQGAESPVNIELKFTDVDLIGLSNSSFTKIRCIDKTIIWNSKGFKKEQPTNNFVIYSGFQVDPSGKYELNVKGPALYLIGPYRISGRVLVLPIQGEGISNITLSQYWAIPITYLYFCALLWQPLHFYYSSLPISFSSWTWIDNDIWWQICEA